MCKCCNAQIDEKKLILRLSEGFIQTACPRCKSLVNENTFFKKTKKLVNIDDKFLFKIIIY